MAAVKAGIANSVLVGQVRNTASWLWDTPHAAPLVEIFERASDDPPADGPGIVRALRLRLAAHYATVATFVPTDVDAHIRHHAWTALGDAEVFAAARSCVDEAAARDASAVSARVTDGLSGHDGEWLSVRAGALGRALALGLHGEAETLAGHIDAELDREERAFAAALDEGAPARRTLALATTLAHNLGDLSRVVEAWPKVPDEHELKRRYSRLGHRDGARARARFVLAGLLNKQLMALENHRFLALRKPRALRRSRDLLLPLGPWFDDWGERVARSPHLDEGERGGVVTALIELHLSSPLQNGCLRALAGIHRATRGGLSSYLPALPARLRKEAGRGRIREAIDVSRETFEARFEKRFHAALDTLTGARHQGGRAPSARSAAR
jgi:hypothetical protein